MNLENLGSFEIPSTEQHYTARDTILYALGLGYGAAPLDPHQLRFVYEQGLLALPTMCNVLAPAPFWLTNPELGVSWPEVLHGEQSLQNYRAIAAAGHVRASYRITAIDDKGAEKGAVLHLEKLLYDLADNALVAKVDAAIYMRGDGGQGGFGEPRPPVPALVEREPDLAIDIPTLPQAALIYRLSGDFNPIHAWPEAARAGGLDRPILHGLCTMGIAARALTEALCHDAPARLQAMSVRFSRMVYPGETIRVEIFHERDGVAFRCRVPGRNAIVIDRGHARLA